MQFIRWKRLRHGHTDFAVAMRPGTELAGTELAGNQALT
jgi:hypothetical protein